MKHTMTKRFGTRLFSLALSTALLVFTAACGSGEGGSSSGDPSGSSSAKGRYVESELALPSPDTNALSLFEIDGRLRLIAYEGLFESSDEGKTWTEMEAGSPALKKAFTRSADSSLSLSRAAWGEDGSLMFSTLDRADNGKETYRYYIVDKDGKERELAIELPAGSWESDDTAFFAAAFGEDGSEGTGTESSAPVFPEPEEDDSAEDQAGFSSGSSVEVGEDGSAVLPSNNLSQFEFLSDGSIAGRDQNGSIYHIDQNTGAVLHTLEPGQDALYYEGFAATRDALAAQYSGGVELYDLSTWERKETDTVLNEFLGSGGNQIRTGEDGSYSTTVIYGEGGISSEAGNAAIFADKKENVFYFCTNGGVYRHIPGGSAMEQIVNGALNSLADPSFHVEKMLKTASGAFKALCWTENGGAGNSLISYDYDPGLPVVPETELKAYALYDSAELRQGIAMYQKAHPDVYINLELAMENNAAMTLSDALRALNANIMAGKGPDVLFLDGMPVKNYMEKGLLADISGVVKELSGDGGVFQNIVSAYAQDGRSYAIPTRFTVPLIDAESDLLPSVQDLNTLAGVISQLRKKNPEQPGITSLNRPSPLLEILYTVCSPSWVKEDGSLDRERLSEFLEQAKKIYDAEWEGQRSPDGSDDGLISFSMAGFGELMATELLTDGALLSLGTLSSINGFSCLLSVNDKANGYSYATLNGQSKNVFTPTGLVGVSAKSSQPDAAKDFVKFLLSEEAQQAGRENGLPVNAAALKELCSQTNNFQGGVAMMSAEGSYSVELTLRDPTEEETAALMEVIQALDTPALQDAAIHDAVLEQGAACLLGEKDVETAVDEIVKAVRLQLLEE